MKEYKRWSTALHVQSHAERREERERGSSDQSTKYVASSYVKMYVHAKTFGAHSFTLFVIYMCACVFVCVDLPYSSY